MKLREALRGNLNSNDRLDGGSQTKIRDRIYGWTSLLVREPKRADGDRRAKADPYCSLYNRTIDINKPVVYIRDE